MDDRKILHLDLDAFYPSVEVLDDPTLQGKPVIVGGIGPRGVVASASYEARKLRVHSALPTAVARRRCPDGVYLRPRFQRYRELSRRVFAVYERWTDRIEPLSLDEAYLDVSHRSEDSVEIARRIRAQVLAETGLTVSAGVSYNKFLAKLASDLEKPDALVHIPLGEAEARLSDLPVARLWGVGPATEAKLREAGIHTFADIREADDILRTLVGQRAQQLRAFAMGVDDRTVSRPGTPKNISAETTFDTDITTWRQAAEPIRRFAERISGSLDRHDRWARTVTLKVRYQDFQTITRSLTGDVAVRSTAEILAAARVLARRVELSRARRVRLVGLGVSNLRPTPTERPRSQAQDRQLALFRGEASNTLAEHGD